MHYYNIGHVHYKYYGEQNYVDWKVKENNIKLLLTPKEWLGRHTDNFDYNIELNKMYAKKFNTDYMLLDDVDKNVKMVHFLGINKNIHTIKNNITKK